MRSPIAVLALLFAAGLGAGSAAAFGYNHGFAMSRGFHPAFYGGYRGHSAYGRCAPAYAYSRVWYTPPPPPPRPLTKQEIYLGAKNKGDRAAARGDFRKAVAQYRDAASRARRLFGDQDRRTRAAEDLLAEARDDLRRHGDGKGTRRYLAAKGKADRSMDRADYDRAARQYREALNRAQLPEQVEEASRLLAEAEALRDGGRGAPAAGSSDELRRGEAAFAAGQYRMALASFSKALPEVLRTQGPESQTARDLTAKLVAAQRALSQGPVGVGFAE